MTPKQTECLRMMERASLVDLTTVGRDGYPSTRAMLNLRNPQQYPHLVPLYAGEANPLTVFMTTNTSSEKFREIAANGKACLYYSEPNAFHAVTLQGVVEIVTDPDLRRRAWMPGWEIYYPAGDEDYTLLRFTPERLKTYSDFSVTTETL